MIILDENRVITETKVFAGYDEENKAFTLAFDIPSIYDEYDKTIEFESDDGEKSIKLLTDNKYIMTRDITQYDHLKAQVVLKKIVDDDTVVLKSNTFEVFLDYSINADGEIDPDDPKITILDQLIDEVHRAVEATNNLNVDADKIGTLATITITEKDGTKKIVEIKDGSIGPIGPKGEKGDKGDTGEHGEQGPQGPKGDTGDVGPQGEQGEKGEKGEKGDTGATGDVGPQGEQGDVGATGADGKDGYTPIKGVDYFTPQDISSLGIDNKEDKTTISSQTATTLQLANNNEYRYSDIASITITLPTTIDTDYVSSLVFSSGATATSFNYSDSIKWSGDDVTDNVFVPAASKRYNIIFWYDGLSTNSVVRGA